MVKTQLQTTLTLLLLTFAFAISFLIGPTPRAGASPASNLTRSANSAASIIHQGETPFTITSSLPNFTVTVSPLSQTRKRGTGAPYFVTITPVNGFNGSVTLTLTGNIPPNGVVSISQPGFGPLHDGEVAIEILKHTFVTGTFAMTIHAISGSLEHDVNISLTIV